MELGDASPSSIIIKIILIINTIIPHDHAFNNIKMQLRTWSSALLCYAARHLDVQSVPVILHSTACSQHSHSCVFTLVENCHHLTFWLQRLHHNTTTYSTTGVSCVRHALFMLFTPDNNSKITILWFMNVSTTKFIDPMKSTNSSIQVFKYWSHNFIVPECFCTSCF